MPTTTQAAEGLMRRRWSVDEIEAAIAAGIIPHGERFDMIGGELVPLAPPSMPRVALRQALAAAFAPLIPDTVVLRVDPVLRLDHDTSLRSDIAFLRGSEVLLAVEVADVPPDYDLQRKARIYAAHDVPELWVVDHATGETQVQREPYDGEYEGRGMMGRNDALVLPFAPAARIALRQLTLP
jgi:hypothetical protein